MLAARPPCALSQFLQRHLPDWQALPLNLVGVPAGLQLASLGLTDPQVGPVHIWTADIRVQREAERLGLKSSFVSRDLPEHLPGRVLLFWPKAREEGYWWLEQLQGYSLDELYLVGENQGGVKAAAKQLAQAGVVVDKLDSARRCSLYALDPSVLQANPPWPQSEQLCMEGPEGLELFSLPGVFGHGRIDEGSQLLLQTLKAERADLPWQGRVLDLGCGDGLLGAWYLKHRPECELLASDVSGFALLASRTTLDMNQLKGQVVAADIFDGLEQVCPPASLDLLITNPPFHTGTATDYDLSRRLISEAPRFLKPGGQLWLVANRFLPYPDLLEAAFGRFHKRAETNKFTVYHAIRGHGDE